MCKVFGYWQSLARISSLALGMVSAVSTAFADSTPSAEACADAAERGQAARDRGALVSAREAFLMCAQPACPKVVSQECTRWIEALEPRIPTIVFSARDERGRDLHDVGVLLDGARLKRALDGRSRAVDPGKHTVRFERESMRAETIDIMVVEGEKARVVRAVFRDAGAAPIARTPPGAALASNPAQVEPAASGWSPPVGSWVLEGVGAAALAGFAYFGLHGASEYRHLEDTCAPSCDKNEIDRVDRELLAADVLLVTGIVTFAAGVTWALIDYRHHASKGRPASGLRGLSLRF